MTKTDTIKSLRILDKQDDIGRSFFVVSGEGADFKCHSASVSFKAAKASIATIRREMLAANVR